jgi:hypothetical protein
MRNLGTDVDAMSYDFVSQVGRLDMPEGCCCDMMACIALFVGVDPAVREIKTFAGGKPDTSYTLRPDGWRANL